MRDKALKYITYIILHARIKKIYIYIATMWWV